MGRRPRYDRPGTWHHVINRGIAKRPLFETRSDARFFLARLVRQVRLGRVEVHAYSLLTTHFHLLVRSPTGELSEAMRRVQNEHSRQFNRRRRRDGSLVRGRYFSKPVHSLEYRRAVVRYLDRNPLGARMATVIGEHELGSARDYLFGTGPRWLKRDWVEADACLLTGRARFSPAAYQEAFGSRAPGDRRHLDELMAARQRSPSHDDPLEDLVGAAPEQVRAWMERKALLADGHRPGLPVCGAGALREALLADGRRRGVWMVEEGAVLRRGAELAEFGLARDFCGHSLEEIGQHCGGSVARARRLIAAHRRLLARDAVYTERASSLAHAALELCHGKRPTAAGEPGG
ncbi:MAG: transposase [Planctomycetota bacterium]|nr:transposase [Planctomycetota bacterium]